MKEIFMAMSNWAKFATTIAALAASTAPALAQSWRDSGYGQSGYHQARYDGDRRDRERRREWERRRDREARHDREARRDWNRGRYADRRDWNDRRGDVRGRDCVTQYDKYSGRWNQRCY
jgi:hypothetical protein